MKKFIYISAFSAAILFSAITADQASAQAPAPPATGGNNPGDQPMGGHAPIGEGMIMLVAMGVAYAAKKFNSHKTAE